MLNPTAQWLGSTVPEQAALGALEAVAGRGKRVKPIENPEKAVGAWIDGIAERQRRGEKLSILDHTALSYFLRRSLPLPQAHRDTATAALSQSWKDLTGSIPADIYDRLPHALTRNARHIEQKFQAASYETGAHPKTAREYLQLFKELRRDYVFDEQDALALSGIAAAALIAPSFTAGLAAGYVFVSFNEWVYHLLLGHPPKGFKRFLDKPWMPKGVKDFFADCWAAHDAHHFQTYRVSNYDQFDDNVTVEKLRALITKRYGADACARMEAQGWGTKFNLKNRILFYAPTLVASAGMFAALGAASLPFFAGLAITTGLLQWGSHIQHPSDHSHAEEAHQHHSWLHRQYLKSKWAGMMATYHHVHHKYPNAIINMNLNPLADLILGRQRRADMNDALEMNFQHSL